MKKILIIEDDRAIAELERDYLELAGFEATIEGDGSLGLARLGRQSFDLVLLDLMLPGTNGFELCRQIRETMDIPLLVVSAKNEDIDKIRALGLGADDFVTKPFSPGELTARVKAHLGRYDRLKKQIPEDREVIEYLDLKVNKASRQVWLQGREITLTAKEFDVLCLFLTNQGRVFSKEDVFGKIWGEQYGDTSTVTVHIRRIREKLGEDPSQPRFIKTVWGSGYRLDP